MDILEKAKELGQMLAASVENKRVIHAEIAQANDKEAQKLLKRYNDKRREIDQKMRAEQPSQEMLEEYRDELQKEFNLLLENKNIKEYIEAKKEFDKLVRSVNDVLNFYITGKEQSGCSPGACGSCSGCRS